MAVATKAPIPPTARRFKPAKYRNEKTTLNGITFDSRREARRYQALAMEQRMGIITDLELQVPFECRVNGVKVCTYVADFTYRRDGRFVVEDAKGVATPEFKLKSKLVKAIHGLDIILS